MIVKDIKEENEYFMIGRTYCPMFKKDISVTFEKEVEVTYVEQCAHHLAQLSDTLIDKICERVSAYHQFMLEEWNESFVEEINEKVPRDVKGRDILKYIDSPKVVIWEPKDGIGYTIAGYCEWEPEHGIDIILRDDKLLYVGPSECLGSWASDDEYEVDF